MKLRTCVLVLESLKAVKKGDARHRKKERGRLVCCLPGMLPAGIAAHSPSPDLDSVWDSVS